MKRDEKLRSGFAKSIRDSKPLSTKEDRKKEAQDLIRKNIRALRYLEDK